MSKVKKVFEPIIAILAANLQASVADVIDEVNLLASAKAGGGGGGSPCFHRNEEGEVVAVKCYYHKLWMDPREVEFGKKTTSATGLNSMCKDGVSKWTKQRAVAKKAEEALLGQLTLGELDVADIPAVRAEIAEAAKLIEPSDDIVGYATLEELLEAQA